MTKGQTVTYLAEKFEVSKKAFSNLWRFQDSKSAHEFFNRWNKQMEKMGRTSRVYYELYGKKPAVMAFAHVEKKKPERAFHEVKGYNVRETKAFRKKMKELYG
jgi:hypothetical protein